MPTITDNYNFLEGAIEGQPATGVKFTARSYLNETGLVLPYGRAIIWDAGNSYMNLPAATGSKFMGVVKRNVIYENAFDAQGFVGFPDQREFDLLTIGDIYVYVETAVNPADPVFFRHTANGAGKDVIGRFRNDADTATCDEIVTGARWYDSYEADSFAILSLNVA